MKDKLAAKRTEISQGVSITETDLTVEQWGREWLDNFKANRVRHSTLDNYDTYFRLHIVPYIGQIKVKELTTLTVQRLYNQLEKKGLSPKSIHDVHGMLHGMLDKAVKMDLLRRNVSSNCELPRVLKHEMHPLSMEEVGQFMELAKNDKYSAWTLWPDAPELSPGASSRTVHPPDFVRHALRALDRDRPKQSTGIGVNHPPSCPGRRHR